MRFSRVRIVARTAGAIGLVVAAVPESVSATRVLVGRTAILTRTAARGVAVRPAGGSGDERVRTRRWLFGRCRSPLVEFGDAEWRRNRCSLTRSPGRLPDASSACSLRATRGEFSALLAPPSRIAALRRPERTFGAVAWRRHRSNLGWCAEPHAPMVRWVCCRTVAVARRHGRAQADVLM